MRSDSASVTSNGASGEAASCLIACECGRDSRMQQPSAGKWPHGFPNRRFAAPSVAHIIGRTPPPEKKSASPGHRRGIHVFLMSRNVASNSLQPAAAPCFHCCVLRNPYNMSRWGSVCPVSIFHNARQLPNWRIIGETHHLIDGIHRSDRTCHQYQGT
jgi:hypothetical protein